MLLPAPVRRWLAVTGGLCISLAFAVTLGFDSPLIVTVSPSVGRAPQDIIINARVWPSDLNRGLTAVVYSEDGDDHSTAKELDGSHEPVQHRLVYAGVGPGEYAVQVCLHRTDKMVCEVRPVMITP